MTAENGRGDLPVKANGKRWNLKTEYDPEDCHVLLTMMRDGASINEVARELQCSAKSIERWAQNFEEFGKALEAGKDWSRGWYEKVARECLVIEEDRDGPRIKFDTKNFMFIMATRFGVSDKVPDIHVEVSKDMDADKTVELVKRLHKEAV